MSATTDTTRLSREAHTAPTSTDRVGLIIIWAIGVVAVITAVLALVNAISWRSTPFIGALVTRELVIDATLPTDVTQWAALNAGLQNDDRILSINNTVFDRPEPGLTPLSSYHARLSSLSIGDTVTVTFERPARVGIVRMVGAEICDPVIDGMSLCEVELTLGRFPDSDLLALFIVPYITSIIGLAVGLALLFSRSHFAPARIAAGVIIAFSGFSGAFFDLNTTHQLSRVWMLAAGGMGGALVALAMIFPIPLLIARRLPWLRFGPIAVGTLLGIALILLHENPSMPRNTFIALSLAPATALAGNILMVFSLLRRRRQATSTIIRDQINTLLIGSALSLIIGFVWLLSVLLRTITGVDSLPLNTQPTMPFLLVPMLSIAYAVMRYRSFDSDRVISQSLTYAVMLIALILGYSMLVLGAALIAGETITSNNPILIAVAVFVIAIAFVPVRMRLQKRIDRIYFRQQADYTSAIETFGRDLGAIGDVSAIIAALRTELDSTLQPTQTYVFLRDAESGNYLAEGTDILFAQSSPLLNALRQTSAIISLASGQMWERDVVAERSRLSVLNAQVIAGLYSSSGALNGFLILAPPRSQDGVYNYEALRYIENLTNQISVAFERAQVVDSLEQRVRELNVFSQISQGVNFTLDIDDQLELIYAQTTRLVDASHFYITLYDRELNELYYAFFLENGDRYGENENRRWRLSNDLFSEIIRSGQPLNVDDYTAALNAFGATPVVEDRRLRAWMGVPLVAGSSPIGVLSVGTIDPGKHFGDEQMKILRDIGLLAATSLDKARLFNETNERARQLAALNDITGEIVAAEKDIDRLLSLITNSATDILNAEAGSLLLTTDDDSGDLEFKVVIGGGGGNLLGVRVPAGRGLVGEVASTARPVIVNEAARDPRWGGEVAKDAAFRTNSVLAVPLITQNRVIGVLEVLNKKRAGGFSGADTQLLIAFAAQGAVAIENARLFQLTDFQLTLRVNELETMERIDVELNRSLDLSRVAEITVRSSMETSGATAALLGLVSGEPPYLQIIYQEGYTDEDMPEGADDKRFPLDRGIVSRVMRSHQPELVYDVRIDPNYVPSKRGALSQITLPMLSAGTITALLVLETDREPRLRLADMPFLQRLAEHASIAITNAQLYAELDRANQSKSEFVSFVAHELKNPLTSIKGYSDFLIKGAVGSLSDPQENFVRTIRSNADRMNTLVSDLNDVTKLQTNNMRMSFGEVAFSTIIEETLRPLQGQIDDKGQKVVIDVPADLPAMHADEGRMIQVMTNLVSNAHKYSPPDGEIRLAAWVDDKLQDERGNPLGPQVHMAVGDQGIGLSPEDLKKLFTAYFRSDNPLAREQPGTGLGLTITRGIIAGHNGLIWVESELGKGTTFHVSIPMAVTAEAAD